MPEPEAFSALDLAARVPSSNEAIHLRVALARATGLLEGVGIGMRWLKGTPGCEHLEVAGRELEALAVSIRAQFMPEPEPAQPADAPAYRRKPLTEEALLAAYERLRQTERFVKLVVRPELGDAAVDLVEAIENAESEGPRPPERRLRALVGVEHDDELDVAWQIVAAPRPRPDGDTIVGPSPGRLVGR